MASTRDIVTPSGVTLRVSARTGLKGLDQRAINAIQAMVQAAPAAGLSVIDITAGREGGHLSHLKGGTEVDLKAYNADGSLWSPAQRVAIAAGAQEAGANRFGLYSFGKGKTGSGSMHVGFSGLGKPAAVWGADSKVRGDASRRFTDPAEKAFLSSYQAGQPFDVASLGMTPTAPQGVSSALASLTAPEGGTEVTSPPSPLQGYVPNIPDASGTPAQQAIEQAITPQPQGRSIPLQLPPQWNPATSFPPPPPRRPGPGGALGVDMGMQPAGMPVPPSRPNNMPLPPPRPGNFDWLGGGAPPAAMVPPPGISPLRPALGGPGDRRPQPPMPQQRPYIGPMPPMRPAGAASMANMPSTVAPPSAPPWSLTGGRGDVPGQMPAAPSPADPSSFRGGPRGDPLPHHTPIIMPDGTVLGGPRQEDLQTLYPAQSLVAGRSEYPGQMPAAPFQTPYGGRPEAAGALPAAAALPRFDQLQAASDSRLLASDIARSRGMMERSMAPLPSFDDGGAASRGLASELGFNRRQMEGYTQPPPSAASMANMPGVAAQGPPNFASADPSVMLPPSWSPATSFPAADTHRSGEWFTPAPPMPAPVADANAGRFDVFDMPSGNIMDLQTAFDSRTAPPSPSYPSPIGITPAFADQPGAYGSAGPPGPAGTVSFDPGRFDAAGPKAGPAAATAPTVPYIPQAGRVRGAYDPVTQTFTPDAAMDIQSEAGKNRSTEAPPPLVRAPATARDPQAVAKPQPQMNTGRQDLGRAGRALTGFFAPFIGGAGGGGLIGPNGFFSNAGSFTPFAGAGGTSPFNQQPNGAMGTTNWRQGSVTGNPAMGGVMWNRSGDNGSVGYVTSPFTGDVPIYSGSPNSF